MDLGTMVVSQVRRPMTEDEDEDEALDEDGGQGHLVGDHARADDHGVGEVGVQAHAAGRWPAAGCP